MKCHMVFVHRKHEKIKTPQLKLLYFVFRVSYGATSALHY